MENTVADYYLQKKPKERVRIYHAHASSQDLKMLNEWRNTPGLKRKVTEETMKQVNDTLLACAKGLPVGTTSNVTGLVRPIYKKQ